MATVAELLTTLNEGDIDLRKAITEKGVAVPDNTPFTELGNKVRAIPQEGGTTEPSDGWTRPADRPPVPTVSPEEIYMLFGVMPTGPNDYAITLTAVGGYRVDWGDGTVETIASATKCEHMYNYASLAVTPNVDGVKWVWIKFTPVSSVFTVINTNVRHSSRPTASSTALFAPQVYEMYLNAPNVTTWAWANTSYTRFYQLEILDWQGVNKITTGSYFLYYAVNLKQLNIYTGLMTNFSRFLYYCCSFNRLLRSIDTSKGTNFSYFMYQCNSFNQPLDIITSNGDDFTYFMYNMWSFLHPIAVDLIKATTAIGTGFIGSNNNSQTGLRLLNMGSIHTALTISNSNLDVTALVALFGDLYNRSSTTAGTLTITGVFGASQLTAQQRAIATSKNWTIVG